MIRLGSVSFWLSTIILTTTLLIEPTWEASACSQFQNQDVCINTVMCAWCDFNNVCFNLDACQQQPEANDLPRDCYDPRYWIYNSTITNCQTQQFSHYVYGVAGCYMISVLSVLGWIGLISVITKDKGSKMFVKILFDLLMVGMLLVMIYLLGSMGYYLYYWNHGGLGTNTAENHLNNLFILWSVFVVTSWAALALWMLGIFFISTTMESETVVCFREMEALCCPCFGLSRIFLNLIAAAILQLSSLRNWFQRQGKVPTRGLREDLLSYKYCENEKQHSLISQTTHEQEQEQTTLI